MGVPDLGVAVLKLTLNLRGGVHLVDGLETWDLTDSPSGGRLN